MPDLFFFRDQEREMLDAEKAKALENQKTEGAVVGQPKEEDWNEQTNPDWANEPTPAGGMPAQAAPAAVQGIINKHSFFIESHWKNCLKKSERE